MLNFVPVDVNNTSKFLSNKQLLKPNLALIVLRKIVQRKRTEHLTVDTHVESFGQIERGRGLVFNIIRIKSIEPRHLFMILPVRFLSFAGHVDVWIAVNSRQLDLKLHNVGIINRYHEELGLF